MNAFLTFTLPVSDCSTGISVALVADLDDDTEQEAGGLEEAGVAKTPQAAPSVAAVGQAVGADQADNAGSRYLISTITDDDFE